MNTAEIVSHVVAGDRRAIARAISMVEDGADGLAQLSAGLYEHSGHAYTIGLTGAPGVGKSSLVEQLVRSARVKEQSVAVLAIDPTSPFTGGALLGDRLRMQSHATDEHVFIRSMATRGHLGGLALAAPEAVRVLDAAGFDLVIVETVGVGQVEVDVATATDTTLVVVQPGMGDSIQAAKAGILEIADVFVVNKADREGADRTVASIEAMLSLESFEGGRWRPPIVKTEATTGKGISELVDAIARFREHTAPTLGERRRARAEFRVRELLAHRFVQHVEQGVLEAGEFETLMDRIAARETDPYSVVDSIMKRSLGIH
jgi:LAO/AO transport system kinase